VDFEGGRRRINKPDAVIPGFWHLELALNPTLSLNPLAEQFKFAIIRIIRIDNELAKGFLCASRRSKDILGAKVVPGPVFSANPA